MIFFKKKEENPIIFFDGVCGLCDRFIGFLIRRNHKKKFLFATLQGETAKKNLSQNLRKDLESVVLYKEGKVYTHSTAVLKILAHFPWFWIFAVLGFLAPTFVRDFFYKKIAKNRYKVFGKKKNCRIPTPEEKSYFLP